MQLSGILSKFTSDAPGPAQYVPKSELSNIKYSIAGKHSQKERHKTPGPGLYETRQGINPDGKFFNSNYKKYPHLLLSAVACGRSSSTTPSPIASET